MRNLLTLWTKRVAPALAFVGLALTACEKEPVYRAPYEKELRFNDRNEESIAMTIVQKFARDTACKHIYLIVTDDNNYTILSSEGINYKRNLLSERIALAPDKISGRGDFHFSKGRASVADSLWFVQHGWTIRQMANHR